MTAFGLRFCSPNGGTPQRVRLSEVLAGTFGAQARRDQRAMSAEACLCLNKVMRSALHDLAMEICLKPRCVEKRMGFWA